jgi:hypothetical protein
MTILQKLKKTKNRLLALAFTGGAIMFVGLCVMAHYHSRPTFLWALIIAGFVLSFFSGIAIQLGIRCPRCKNLVGHIIAPPTNPFVTPADLKCCPYCQIDFHEDR